MKEKIRLMYQKTDQQNIVKWKRKKKKKRKENTERGLEACKGE